MCLWAEWARNYMLGRIQSGPNVSIRVSYAQKYPKIIKLAGYVSETYPSRIRIRYVSDTGYARCAEYRRIIGHL